MRKQPLLAILLLLNGLFAYAQSGSANTGPSPSPLPSLPDRHYLPGDDARRDAGEHPGAFTKDTTRELVTLVQEAATLVRQKGEAAFTLFRQPGSRWRTGETYIFVLDPKGNMLVNADPELEGKNQLELKDLNGKPIIRGLLHAATALPGKPEGWYHYEWPVPGGITPRWKSSYVQLVKAPSGKSYVVGSGMYNNRMEREFVVDAVKNAVIEIEKNWDTAFRRFHDPAGPYRAKDAYIFVIDPNGVELVNSGFTNLEGRNVLDVKDKKGKLLVREMLKVVQNQGSGWVDYMWPKQGESFSTQKSTYVSKARKDDGWVLVGCGVYLADAPKAVSTTRTMTAPELMTLVRDAAAVLEKSGESAFPEFRKKGFRWLMDDTYFFVFSMDGTRAFHAVDPQSEGRNDLWMRDVVGRPMVKMFLEAGATPKGEGWVHYMWPEPGDIFPAWKSSFVKRVTFPSGKQYIIGSGIYNMQMDKAFIEDVVNRAADLIAERGKEAFPILRDKTGPFYFMDTYVFVETPEGTELVNAAFPNLEGRSLLNLKDATGKIVVRDEIDAVMKDNKVWITGYFYKPGQNEPAQKLTYLRKVQHGDETYIVGSGLYLPEEGNKVAPVRKLSWKAIEKEKIGTAMVRQVIAGERSMLTRFTIREGTKVPRHFHPSEEYFMVLSGAARFVFDDGHEQVVNPNEIIIIPPDVPHSIVILKKVVLHDFFSPPRQDWLEGKDEYLRQ